MQELSDRELLIRMDERLSLLHDHLMGNGQPGILAELGGRIDDLEASRDRARGAKWVVGVLGSVVWGVAEYLFHHRG